MSTLHWYFHGCNVTSEKGEDQKTSRSKKGEGRERRGEEKRRAGKWKKRRLVSKINLHFKSHIVWLLRFDCLPPPFYRVAEQKRRRREVWKVKKKKEKRDSRVLAPVERSPLWKPSGWLPKLSLCLCNWGNFGIKANATREIKLSENKAGWWSYLV